MARKVSACVLYGGGLNCDYETERAFRYAGAEPERALLGRLKKHPDLSRYDILAIPGGFSYGDNLGAGKVLAVELQTTLGEQLRKFIADRKPVLGVCNGFQALVKGGFLPDMDGQGRQEVTLTYNAHGRFEDRWVTLRREAEHCLFTEGIETLEVPVRHGEGNFFAPEGTLARLEASGLVAFRYAGPNGEPDPPYPHNPNGSLHSIAAITNREGNVLGIMPHPEVNVSRLQHPRWTRESLPEEGPGLLVFRNAVEYVRKNL